MKMYNPAILKRAEARREKQGVKILDHTGRLYKAVKALYILAFCWMILMQALYLFGSYMLFANSIRSALFTVTVTTVLSVAGFILLLCRRYLLAAVLNLIPTVIGTLTLYSLLSGNPVAFVWRHGIPAVLLLVTAAALCTIGLRAKRLLAADYKKEVERLYLQHKDRFSGADEKEWRQFLNTYTGE